MTSNDFKEGPTADALFHKCPLAEFLPSADLISFQLKKKNIMAPARFELAMFCSGSERASRYTTETVESGEVFYKYKLIRSNFESKLFPSPET